LYTLVEEIAETFEKCNIQNFLKHISEDSHFGGCKLGCVPTVPFLLEAFHMQSWYGLKTCNGMDLTSVVDLISHPYAELCLMRSMRSYAYIHLAHAWTFHMQLDRPIAYRQSSLA